jgi:hypothetical protein
MAQNVARPSKELFGDGRELSKPGGNPSRARSGDPVTSSGAPFIQFTEIPKLKKKCHRYRCGAQARSSRPQDIEPGFISSLHLMSPPSDRRHRIARLTGGQPRGLRFTNVPSRNGDSTVMPATEINRPARRLISIDRDRPELNKHQS